MRQLPSNMCRGRYQRKIKRPTCKWLTEEHVRSVKKRRVMEGRMLVSLGIEEEEEKVEWGGDKDVCDNLSMYALRRGLHQRPLIWHRQRGAERIQIRRVLDLLLDPEYTEEVSRRRTGEDDLSMKTYFYSKEFDRGGRKPEDQWSVSVSAKGKLEERKLSWLRKFQNISCFQHRAKKGLLRFQSPC